MNFLTAFSVAIVVTTLAQAQTPLSSPAFDVVSIKPNTTLPIIMETPPPTGGRLNFTRATLKAMLGIAYQVKQLEIEGGPQWISTDRYDVAATTTRVPLSAELYRVMLQNLLQDRFKLAVHRETREKTIFGLVADKRGPRLPPAKEGSCAAITPGQATSAPSGPMRAPCGGFNVTQTHMEGAGVTTGQVAEALSNIVGRPVLDKSGATGKFDVSLDFTRESTVFRVPAAAPDSTVSADGVAPSIFTALQEKLGLRLESQKGQTEVLVIDHAEKPSEN